MTIATDNSTGTDEVRSADTWVATKLRYLLEVNPATPVELRAQRDRLVPFIPMEALGEDGSLDATRERPVAELLTGYSYFANGDVLMAKVTPCFENGKAALVQSLSRKHGFGSTELTTLRAAEGLDPAFLYYLVRSDHFRQASIAAMTGAGGLKRVPDEHIRSFETLVPPETEQRAITNFLDRETAKIDALIAKQEQLIATLREDRAVTITEAVTKGLDPTCELVKSDSGWIDSFPAHWGETKLKWNVSTVTSGSRGWAQYYSDDGEYFIRIGNLTRGSIGFDDSNVQRVSVPLHAEGSRTMTRKGDLLFSITAFLGSVAVVDEHHVGAFVSQHVALARLTGSSLDPNYVGYTMLSELGQRQLKEQAYGGTKVQLSLDDIRSIALLLPPKEEQTSIVSFLDSRCAQIDALIAKSTAMIETLREYRSALITNAVTGKIDVREAV